MARNIINNKVNKINEFLTPHVLLILFTHFFIIYDFIQSKYVLCIIHSKYRV